MITLNKSHYLILFGLFDTFMILREGSFNQDIEWLLEYRRNLYNVQMKDLK